MATDRHKTRHRLAQGPTFGLGRGLDDGRCDHLVTRGRIHETRQLLHLHRRVKVQLRKSRLLQHPTVRRYSLQLHHQPGLPLAPEPVTKAQSVCGLKRNHIRHEARHPLLAQDAGCVELGNRCSADDRYARKEPGHIATIRAHDARLRQKGANFIIATIDGARSATERLHPLQLLLAVACMPDA